jgi:uncharacterized tellurite resistance protein B-like protein
MNQEERIRVARLIAGLVVSDDDLDDKEDAFIERMLASFGIPSSDRNLIFPIVDAGEAAAALRDLSKEAQDEAVTLLIQAAAVDGKVSFEERNYLVVVAEAVGLSTEALDKRLDEALAKS